MIAYLKGQLLSITQDSVIVNVSGVGYKVKVPKSHLKNLSEGSEAEFFIHTHVKEDQLSLYGFSSQEYLGAFELLLNVPGIGPKTALVILSNFSLVELINNIRLAKVEKFIEIPGIGRKAAQKIIVELQSKLGKIEELNLEDEEEDQELTEALINLGYSKKEAKKMSEGTDKNLPINERLKRSLKGH